MIVKEKKNPLGLSTESAVYTVLKRDYTWISNALWRAIEICLLSQYPWDAEDRVLDLGCGDGFISDILFKGLAIDLIGTDYTLRHLQRQSSFGRGKNYKALLCSDGRYLPFKDGAFSAVLSNCVIEHIPDVGLVLSEVNRILRPEGKFIFTVPTPQFGRYSSLYRCLKKSGLMRLAEYYVIRQNKRVFHVNIMDIHEWDDVLKKEGFVIQDYKHYMKPMTAAAFENIDFFYWLGAGKIRIHSFLVKAAESLERIGINKQRELVKALFKNYLVNLVQYDLNCPDEEGAALYVIAQKIRR